MPEWNRVGARAVRRPKFKCSALARLGESARRICPESSGHFATKWALLRSGFSCTRIKFSPQMSVSVRVSGSLAPPPDPGRIGVLESNSKVEITSGNSEVKSNVIAQASVRRATPMSLAKSVSGLGRCRACHTGFSAWGKRQKLCRRRSSQASRQAESPF